MEDEAAELKTDPLHEVKERFKYAVGAWADNRKRYKEDVEFLAGDQWPQEIQDIRDKAGQPCLVVDKLNQYVRQVVNDSRQNRPSIKVRPVDSGADIETADILQGLCRHIEDRSDASAAYDTGIDGAVRGGFGFVRILTEYAHDQTFEQEICIDRVRNPLSVIVDPDFRKADGSDIKYAFVIDEIHEDQFKAEYPNVKESTPDFEVGELGWTASDKMRVIAEYFEIVKKPRKLHLLEDGTSVPDDEYQAALDEGLKPPAIKDTRNVELNVVMWSKLHGKGYIEEPREWIGKYIPIVPIIGNETDIDGKISYTGLCHSAKDSQRLYNYSRSAFAERVALAPKAPYVAAAGQIENHPEWEDANAVNYSVLTYDPVSLDGKIVGAPQRQPASDIPAGFSQDMQLSEHDIQASLGMYAASLGQQGNEKSGKAIMARQREGDTSTFHFHDNLARSIRHIGKIVVDLIPKVYDSDRVIRIIGEDGTPDMVQISPELSEAKVKIGSKTVYNLNVGTYDVSVTAGASYTTRRVEAAEAMMQMTQGNPQLMGIMGDLMVKNMDWPGAEEMAKRLKLMLPPQILQAEQQEGEVSPEVQQVMAQAQQAMQEKDMQIQQAEQMIQKMGQELQQLKSAQDDKMLTAKVKQGELEIKSQELQIKGFEAETNRIKTMAEIERVQREAESAGLVLPPDTSIEQAKLALEEQKIILEREKAQLQSDTQIVIKQMDIDQKPTPKKAERTELSITGPSGKKYKVVKDDKEITINSSEEMAGVE